MVGAREDVIADALQLRRRARGLAFFFMWLVRMSARTARPDGTKGKKLWGALVLERRQSSAKLAHQKPLLPRRPQETARQNCYFEMRNADGGYAN